MKYRNSLLSGAFCTGLLALSACGAPQQIAYFQDFNQNPDTLINLKSAVITAKPTDKLYIGVKSKDPQISQLFNLTGTATTSTVAKDAYYYTVDSKGNIDFPVLGTVHVANLSREQVAEKIKKALIDASLVKDPATYLKAYDAIRALFANQPLAKQMGFTPQYFSFNTEGGRCEECKGAGYVTIEMQFMADLTLTCEACKGKRFKHDILEVRYGGKDVNDVLNMTVNEAIEFFSDEKLQRNEGDFDNCRIIVNRLKPLQDVGLGYIKLGQNSSSLSGGENQRVKLAFFIGKEEQEPTLFIFDEPTTGLHFHDIKRLLHAFNALIERGHSLVVIEHNLDVIKCADYIIDLGPEGGDKGGNLVVAGTPEEVAACKASLTGKFLR